jgi:hypothetical protein
MPGLTRANLLSCHLTHCTGLNGILSTGGEVCEFSASHIVRRALRAIRKQSGDVQRIVALEANGQLLSHCRPERHSPLI